MMAANGLQSPATPDASYPPFLTGYSHAATGTFSMTSLMQDLILIIYDMMGGSATITQHVQCLEDLAKWEIQSSSKRPTVIIQYPRSSHTTGTDYNSLESYDKPLFQIGNIQSEIRTETNMLSVNDVSERNRFVAKEPESDSNAISSKAVGGQTEQLQRRFIKIEVPEMLSVLGPQVQPQADLSKVPISKERNLFGSRNSSFCEQTVQCHETVGSSRKPTTYKSELSVCSTETQKNTAVAGKMSDTYVDKNPTTGSEDDVNTSFGESSSCDEARNPTTHDVQMIGEDDVSSKITIKQEKHDWDEMSSYHNPTDNRSGEVLTKQVNVNGNTDSAESRQQTISVEATKSYLLAHRPLSGSCPDRSFNYSSMISQLRGQTADKRFSCKYCNETFSVPLEWEEHERFHPEVKCFPCRFCDKKFAFKSRVKTHELLHTGEKPFQCHYCDRRFVQKNNRDSHERQHTGDKPFVCGYCFKTFAYRSRLQNHEKLHRFGDKPFFCKYCDKSFAYKQRAENHERIHTSENPFSCGSCDNSFIQKPNNNELLHSAEKVCSCSSCGKTFSDKSFLATHKCELCVKQEVCNDELNT